MHLSRILLLALLLSLLAAPAPAQEAGKPDLGKISPEDLRGPDVDALVRKAHEAYNDGRFEDAARAFVAVLRRAPGDANSTYNLACCFGLLGYDRQAARFLEAAWEAGFRDLDHIRNDPDFDEVRESAPFAAAMERIALDAKRREREEGRLLPVTSPAVAQVRVIEPPEPDPWSRYPLVVGLHGLGGDAGRFATLFRREGLDAPGFYYVVPQAPYPFPVGGRVGYSWTLRLPGIGLPARMESYRLAEKYVLRAVLAAKREYRIDERKVFLLGFSQGAGMAFGIGMRHPETFAGVIPIGGWFDAGEFTRAEVAKARKRGRFLICASPEDRVVPFSSSEAAAAFMEEHGIEHRLVRYAGGHAVPDDVVRTVLAFVGEPAGEAGAEPVEEAPLEEPKDEGVRLRHRFEPGKTLRYRTSTEVDLLGYAIQVVRRQSDETTWTIAVVTPEGEGRIEIRYDALSLEIERPGAGKTAYDSAYPPSEEEIAGNPMLAAAHAMVGKSYTVRMGPLGDVRQVSGLAEILSGALANAPGGAEMARDAENRRGTQLQFLAGYFPEEPVTAGSRWERTYPVKSPLLGILEVKVAYEVASIAEVDGRKVARIAFAAEIPGGGAEGGAASGAKLEEGKLEGEMTFDATRGEVLTCSSEMTTDLEVSDHVFSVDVRSATERVEGE